MIMINSIICKAAAGMLYYTSVVYILPPIDTVFSTRDGYDTSRSRFDPKHVIRYALPPVSVPRGM
jgi:hypothetical protein